MDEILRPRLLVFETIEKTWGIKRGIVFELLASDYLVKEKDKLNKHIRSRTDFYKAAPDQFVPGEFKPFANSAVTLVSLIHAEKKGPRTNGEIAAFIAGEASRDLAASLARYGFDSTLYSNSVNALARDEGLSDADKAELLVLLYCASGCTGDVVDAVRQMRERNRSMGSLAKFATVQNDGSPEPEPVAYDLALTGVGGSYPLYTGPEGTVIGSMPTEPHAISDVGGDVSKRHARIWRDDSGAWWVEGLGSTNGTTLNKISEGRVIVVEPPQSERERGATCEPVEVHLSDILTLGGSTQFWVTKA